MVENPKEPCGVAKPAMSCVPLNIIMRVALAFQEGARKYGKFNWRIAPTTVTTYIDACLGHIIAYTNGEDIDSESGLHHLEKAIADLIIILDATKQKTAVDDRPIFAKIPNERAASQEHVEELFKRYPNNAESYTQFNLEQGKYDDGKEK